ncbi:MAG: hypothetical protein ACREQW_03920 [Candidatus Binatia bacterium]
MALAARGTRNLDTGEEGIHEINEQEGLWRQARRVHIESAIAGIVLTILFLFLSQQND